MNPKLRTRVPCLSKGLLTLFFSFLSYFSLAQALFGTYTVGPGGNYTTLTAAVADLTSKGVSAPVVFKLKDGTFSEQVSIGAITGSSATNTITFESESGDAANVILSFAPTSTDNYVIRLNNASFVTFRNFSIETSGTTYTRGIYGINNLNNITFQGLKVTLPSTNSFSEERGAVIIRPAVSSNIRLINNTITGGSHGILHIGNSSSYSPGTVFTGNAITNVYARPAYLEYMNGIVFNDNMISHTGSAYSDYYGTGIQNTSGYLEMKRNRITGAVGHAMRLSYCGGIVSQPSIIANNFFQSNSNYGTFYIIYGLNYTNIYHNSVHNTSTGEAFYFNRYQSTDNRIVNNIFKANAGYAVEYQNSTAASITESDYNNLFTSGSFMVREASSSYGTLEQWQAASVYEDHSVSFDPQFQSNTQLYASAPGIASAGKDLLAIVSTDIDGVARTATPSLGATQYSAAALTPLSGTYTIGTGAFDFTSINAAIDAMKTNGINGPVTFLLNSQTFSERFILPFVSGMSAANPIIFESQSGNPTDVVMTPAAATDAAGNYIVRLSNAAHVTIRNITFQPATGTNFNRAIHVENRADNLTFENLRIILPATTSYSEERGAIIARTTLSSNIRFINNTITGGSHGILHIGNSSSYSPGTVFTGNTITNVYARPAYFEYMNGIVFNDNTITHTGSAYSDYYGAAIHNTSGYLEMMRNRITGAVGHAIRLSYCSGLQAQPSIIANNFLHSNSNYATVYIIYGLNYTNIYHNSVHNSSTGEAFNFNRYQSTGNRIINNIFKANAGFAVEYQNSNAPSIAESDYNNLFTSGSFVGRIASTSYGTLEEWKTGSGFEANSLSIDPQFQSNTALYTAVSALAAAGKNINADVPDDIDGIARPSTPSLGAAQFGASGTPLTGEYTINSAGSGTTNFTTFAAALDALKNFGISGPVVFKITGDFNEQLTFLAVSGSSATNTVTFESATGQPGDAVIHYASSNSGSNFTIRLSNADHHRFRNLTIKADDAAFARAVHLINRTVDITFEGNVIESAVTTATSSDRGGILIASALAQNVQLLNNTIRNGSYGIQFTGPSSKGTGTIIRGNIIDKAFYRGIDLTYHSAFIVDKNQVLNNPSSTAFTGMDISNVDGAFQITANKVTGGNGSALSLTSALAAAGTPALIANNFFQTNNGSGYQTVYLNYLRNVNIYHNNVNATGTGNGFYYVSSSGQNINIVNNIIKATDVAINIVNPGAIGQIDYNDYFTPGSTLGNWGTSGAGDLAAWQAQTGQDANSLSVDPQYQSDADLAALASSLAGAGLDLTAIVPTDINGTTRAVPVSIGASQFSAAFALDGTVSRLISPGSSCSLTNAEDVRIEVTNLGASTISAFQVAYRLNSQTPVVETVSASVSPGAKFQYTFSQKLDLSAKATYALETYMVLTGDQNTPNDLLTTSITHYPDLTTTISDNSTVCQGQPVTLTATGGVQYLWSTGANSATITVSPTATTTYTVQITNANNCKETREVTVTVRDVPTISFTGDTGYTSSYVSPLQGGSDALFDFRIIYTDANGNLPAAGYPRVELDANANGQPTDPFDIIKPMVEADAADTDVTDGKEYRAGITNLADNITWRSRIVASNTDGCPTQTPFVSSPSVSNDLLDVGIYASDISFSKSNPAINESIKIYARVRNTSDYLAENFVVNAYIEDQIVFTQTIVQLNPQTSVTLQWDQSFAVAGFFPVKVVIDETNVLNEDNELNNFAIRPILTGDYQLPGGINVNASADPLTLQAGQAISITGTAQYYGIDPDVNPDVAGATVIARITNGGQTQTTTRPDGTYSLSISAPTTPGTYSLNIEVTDYTLTGYQGPIEFTVLPAPPRPDLSVYISLDRNTIITGEQISGSVILQNVGDVVANDFLFRYFNCDAVLGEEQIASLAPGESKTYIFTTTTGVIGDCFNRNNCQFSAVADVGNTIVEKTETNNQSSAYLTVLPAKPDLTPLNVTNSIIPGSVNMLNPFTFSVRVDNIGGVNATLPFIVNVYIGDVLIRSENVLLLNTCDGNTFVVTHDFGGDTSDKVLTIKVDEPIGSGVIDEYRETNNEFSKIIRHVPPPPQYPNLSVSNYDVSVTPTLPPAGSPFIVDVVYRNNGQLAVGTGFNVETTVLQDGGSPDIETQAVSPTILPGATRNASRNTTLATDGNHSFTVRLDPENNIGESSEGDNIAQMPLCVDLSVSAVGSVWGSFYVNTLQHLTARIYNYGLFTPTDASVSFYLDGVKIATEVLPVVEPWTHVIYYSVSVPHMFDQVGTFELKVVVDDPASYTECREDNNEYKANITVRAPAPDVRVFSEYISPSKINPDVNEPVSIFLSYDNTGIGDSGPFKARILVDDVPLGTDVTIPSVAAGDDGTVEVPTPYISAAAGIRIIRAILDPDTELSETTRLNNEATRALVVGDAPNLLFTDLQPDIACPDDGATVIVTASLSNVGDFKATAGVNFYYITESDTIPIDTKTLTLAGGESTTLQTEWLVINKTFSLYAEIVNSDPMEYDETDNTITTKFCGGPYYNLFVETEGQGITQKTPNLVRYEGAQQVTITAVPATGWVFAGWQGDATGIDNPLTLDLNSDRAVVAVFTESLGAPSVTDDARCGPGSLTLQASGAVGAQSYAWYTQATGGNPIDGETSATLTIPDLEATTSYYVAIASFNSEGPRAEVKANIFPLPAQPVISYEGDDLNCPSENNPIPLVAPAGFAGYLWSNDETTQQIEALMAGAYTVQVVDNNGCVSIASPVVTLTEEFCNDVIVHNALSPENGDVLNDYLHIEHIDILPDAQKNRLKIYNRWGDVVFEATDYDNVNNTFTGRTSDGKKLPSGTYFYTLEFQSGRKKMSGYIVVRW